MGHTQRKRLEHTFTWSISGAEAFAKCKRKHWLNRYGSWEGWELGAPVSAMLAYRLKQLKSRDAYVGQLVHDIIASEVGRLIHGAAASTADQLAESFRMRLRAAYSQSLRAVTEGRSPPANKHQIIFEDHHFGADEKDRWAASAETGVLCLAHWRDVVWPELTRDAPTIMMPEQTTSVFLPAELLPEHLQWCASVPFYATPDLVLSSTREKAIKVVDWKTGQRDEHHREQMVAYSLLMILDGTPPDDGTNSCSTALAYLRTGEIVEGWPTLGEFEAFVCDQAHKMAEARNMLEGEDEIANVSIAKTWRDVEAPEGAAFDKYPCGWCCYRGLCHGEVP